MKFLVFLILCLFLFPKNFTKPVHKNFFPTLHQKTFYSKDAKSFHSALITGNKSGLTRKMKDILKSYGLLHLLTPSGLHLSSLLLLFSKVQVIEIFVLTILIIILNTYFYGYDSMTRVIAFRLIHKSLRKVEIKNDIILISFILTIIFSLLIGHLNTNPLSFFYSFIFWGTILKFRNNYLLLLIILHFIQVLMGSITGTEIHPLSIIINPLITGIVTFLYPLIFGLSFIASESLTAILIEMIVRIVMSLEYLNQIPSYELNISSILISLYFLINKKFKMGVVVLVLNINSTARTSFPVEGKWIISIPPINEVLYQKRNKFNFIDRVCEPKPFQIKCKKKPSHLGGPKI